MKGMGRRRAVWVLIGLLFAGGGLAESAGGLVVYSARKEQMIKPLFETYTKATGVKIDYLTDEAGPLLERIKAEAEDTAADLLITVDAGNLWKAAEENLLREVRSEVLDRNVPLQYRDSRGRWFGLSLRARTIVYNTGKVRPSELSTYEGLADPVWRGRLCLRTSKKVYNQSLVAMMIAELGEPAAEEIVKAWVANLAAPVFSNDTAMMEAIAGGQCDVGIGNTYYYGQLMAEKPGLALALFWPNQADRGVHVNISGAGVTLHAKHPEEAVRFLEWLSAPEAQRLFADLNLEYPVNTDVSPHPSVAAWGDFKKSAMPVSKAGEFQSDAVRLMDRAGYA